MTDPSATEVLYTRVSKSLKNRLWAYAKAKGIPLTSACALVLDAGLRYLNAVDRADVVIPETRVPQ